MLRLWTSEDKHLVGLEHKTKNSSHFLLGFFVYLLFHMITVA